MTGLADRRRRAPAAAAGALTALLLAAAPARGQGVLVAHLPGVPVEAAQKVAAAVADLGDYLNGEIPGLELEVEIFRRWQDASDYLAASEGQVVLFLTAPCFLLDLPVERRPTPRFRLVRDGRETQHLHLVVRSEATQEGLEDLRDASLSTVRSCGPSRAAFLETEVFGGRLQPEGFFDLASVEDEFSATANVLYRQTDAALVSEHNPLLEQHLDQELKVVYSSPPLSLPVLAFAEQRLAPERMRELERALADLGRSAAGQALLAELRSEGLAALAPLQRIRLAGLPEAPRRALEIARPARAPAPSKPPAATAEDAVFILSVELPEVPIPEADPARD